MIEFDCEICGEHVRKAWSDSSPGRPRFCSVACKAEAQRRARPVTRAWLEQKYVVEGLDCVQIGRLVGRDPKSVWVWMQSWGIPTRPRGSDPRQHFRKGEPNLFAGRKHTPETRTRLREIAIAQGRRPFKAENGPPMRGKHGAETPNWKGGITPERQAFYRTPEWRDACKSVWHNADAHCERCGVHHNTAERRGTFHVHHIVGFSCRELRAEPSNLALLCNTCHHFVHSRKNVAREFLRDAEATLDNQTRFDGGDQ